MVVGVDHNGCMDYPSEGTCCHCGMVRSFDSGHMANSYHKYFRMPPHMVGTGVACLDFGSRLAGSCSFALGVVDMAFPDLGEHTLVASVADLGHYAAVPVLFLPPEAAAIWEALFSAGRESAAGSELQTKRVAVIKIFARCRVGSQLTMKDE